MTKDEAKNLLLNAAWLGTDETREKTEEAVRMAIELLEQEPCDKCVYSTKDGYCQYDDIAETIPQLEPCEDAISRQAVLDAFWKLNVEIRPSAINAITKMITDIPPVTPQQNVENPCIDCGMNCCVDEVCKKKNEFLQQNVGHWIVEDDDIGNDNIYCKCSNCGHGDEHAKGQEVPYCWWCGAKMAEREDKE